MVRAGLIRQMGAGLWTYLPAGWRVERKVEAIIREEMESIGCQEMLMPVLQPAEAWEKTGRYAIDELFKLEDRKGAPMVLAMTHEEAVTYHVAREVRSYRDLPLMLFHIQTKERDEPRPRAGVLRTREFTMKDAYSFDRDEEGLARSYELQAGAYERILDRGRPALVPGRVRRRDDGRLRRRRVHGALPGRRERGGPGAGLRRQRRGGNGASLSRSSCRRRLAAPEEVDTPGLTKVEEVAGHLGLPAGAFIKTLPIVVEGRGMVLVLLRGDHRLNEIKLRNGMGTDFRQASSEEIEAQLGPVGYLGPVGSGLPIITDAALTGRLLRDRRQQARHPSPRRRSRRATSRPTRWTCARSRPAIPLRAAARSRSRRRSRSATSSSSAPATRSRSAPPTSTRTAAENPIVMGSYGIGPARIVAASIEQRADERGIVWPRSLAPWQVHLVSLAKAGETEREAADKLYEELRAAGAEVLYDDRDAGPGEKLTDAELLGCPLRIVAGRRGLAEGVVEATERGSGAEHKLPLEDAAAQALELLGGLDPSDG